MLKAGLLIRLQCSLTERCNYYIVMFNWCCQDQQELNEQVFLYRGNSESNSRQVINVSQLNPVILQEERGYQVFVASQYDFILKKCRQRSEDFTDPEFNVKKQDMPKINGRKIAWKRLKNFAQSINDPLYERRTMNEVIELNERDLYFLASIAALNQQPGTMMAILDGVNSFNEQGIYKLNVCVSGKPKQIVIDDFVPVFQDNPSRAAFIKAQHGALWVLLLEKAYAKLKGGFNNIVSGYAHEVLTTFTVAPCLTHVIPLTFDHYSQQLIWSKIIEARKNRFPVVCGSRKQYTCKGIAMNHAYPLIDCQIQDNNGYRLRIVRLVSIPPQNAECAHNNQCSFQIQGSTIKMQLVQFMRNFELMDVAHLCKNFNSHFYSYKSSAGSFKFYTVGISGNTSFYLTLQHNSQQRGRLRIFFTRELSNSLTDYELISCKSQELFSDVSLQFHNLPQGKYVVCCQSSLNTDCTLRVYSEAHLAFFQLKLEPIKFLEHIFYDYALKNKQDHILLDKNNNDWYYSKIMFQEAGLGFLIIGLDNTSTIKCYLTLRKDQLEKEGYRVLNKAGKLYKAELVKSNIEILIFEMPAINNAQICLEFPPRSLQMKLII